MMANYVDMDALLEELKKKAASRNYSDELPCFREMNYNGEDEEDNEFYMPYLERDMRFLNQNYYIDYNQPVMGKYPWIKKLIKKLYRFHLEPISDRQNDFNMEVTFALNQLKNFAMEQMKENESLRKQLEEIKKQEYLAKTGEGT